MIENPTDVEGFNKTGAKNNDQSNEKKNRKPRKIVHALDHSEHAMKALEWTLENLLNPESDHLVLLSCYVKPTSKVSDYFSQLTGKQPTQQELEEQEAKAEQFARDCLKDAAKLVDKHGHFEYTDFQLSHEIIGADGDVRELICEFCKDNKADILVVGSRGMSALKKQLMGSVSDYVVGNAPCPVLVIR